MDLWLDDDIVEVGPTFPQALNGKRDFFLRYREYFTASRRIQSYRIRRPRTVLLSPSLALVHFLYSMRVVDGDSLEDSHGKESMIVSRRHGRWKVRFIHWHRDH